MKNLTEFKVKNLNKEKIIKQISKITSIYNVKIEQNVLFFSIPKKNRNKVEKFLSQKEIEVLAKEKKGFLNFLSKTVLRIGVITPIVLFCVFLLVSNMFVFKYQIIGAERVDCEQIEQVLKDNNVYGIVNKHIINTTYLENQILDIDKVSLVSVIIKGNTLVVNIKEKLYNQEFEERNEFSPLKSQFNGIITEISLVQGTPLVKVGQTVKIGQELVAPYVINTSGQKLSISPMADIKADVFLTTTTLIPNEKLELVDTGQVVKTKNISLFGLNIYSNNVGCNFKKYRKQTITTNMSSNLLLPIKIEETYYFEQTEVLIEHYFVTNKEQILQDCQQKTRQLVKSCEIIKEEYTVVTTNANINQITHTAVVNKSIC